MRVGLREGRMIVNCDIHIPDKVLRKHIRYMKKKNLQSTTFDYKNQPVYIYIENKNEPST